MNKRVCRPIQHRDAHSAEIERELIAWFREAIFTPLVLVMEEHKGVVRENEVGINLVKAMREGQVSYVNDRFVGTFSAAVARELRLFGAKYQAGSFVVPLSALPYYLRAEVAASLSRGKAAHAAVLAFLAAALGNVESSPETVDVRIPARLIIGDLALQFRDTFADVEVPQFTDEDRRKLAEETATRLDAALRGLVTDRLPELRRRVELNLAARGDTNTLAALLEHEFGVVKTRAKQIAEHETALLIAKFRQARYESAGVQSYVWETKQDERVRPGHSALHGREFSWANPPIVDPATGRRCHPGEDYNCRCAPLPIIFVPSES